MNDKAQTDSPFTGPLPQLQPAKPSKFKKLSKRTKALIGGGLAALLATGGWFAYSASQTPEAFIGSAFASLVKVAHPGFELTADLNNADYRGRGSLDIYTADSGTGLKLNVAGFVANRKVGASLNVLSMKNGDLYGNLADYQDLLQLLQSTFLPTASTESLDKALNGVWVKVGHEELKGYTKGNSCLSNKVGNSTYANSLAEELGSNIFTNFFVVPKKELPQVDGNRVFTLSVDANKLKSFLLAFTHTSYYADLKSCNSAFKIDSGTINSITQAKVNQALAGTTITLYAKADSRDLTKIDIAYSSDGTEVNLEFKPLGDQSAKVVAPAKSVSITDFLASLSALG